MVAQSKLRQRLSMLGWYAIAVLFTIAGSAKLMDLGQFTQDILNYRIIDERLATWLAVYLPFLEIVSALSLLLPNWRRSGGIILLFLTLTFTGAIVSAWIRGIDLNCGCLGMLMQTTDIVWMLGRNVLIVVVLSVLVYGEFARERE